MSEIVFTDYGKHYGTLLSYGANPSTMVGILDSGAECTMFNTYALSRLLKVDEDRIIRTIRNSDPICRKELHTPTQTNSFGYVCRLSNILMDDVFWKNLYILAIPHKLYRKDGSQIERALLGVDLLKCAYGEVNKECDENGNGMIRLRMKDMSMQGAYFQRYICRNLDIPIGLSSVQL